MKDKKATLLSLRNSINRSRVKRALAIIVFALGCMAYSPMTRAVSPAPDGDYPGGNTAEGGQALQSLTTGLYNTASGFRALFSDTTGKSNTAQGVNALFKNNTGYENTAVGVNSLYNNTIGNDNTATGYVSLFKNSTGYWNSAYGSYALYSNTDGIANTASGYGALYKATASNNTAHGYAALDNDTTGTGNTAIGSTALFNNTTGPYNTALGYQALYFNTTSVGNTALGTAALYHTNIGGSNTAIGFNAGLNITGNFNIDINNVGVSGESATIRIGTPTAQTRAFIAGIRGVTTGNANAVNVVIDSAGQLGTQSSSARFKKDIKPMKDASDSLMRLKPVTFHYKSDATDTPQFGLIAEEVAQVNPAWVVRDEKGEIYTVRYDAINAMLLNEFLKEHREVEELETTVIQQRKQMETVVAHLKEQESKIQKVSAQLELKKPAPQVVLGGH